MAQYSSKNKRVYNPRYSFHSYLMSITGPWTETKGAGLIHIHIRYADISIRCGGPANVSAPAWARVVYLHKHNNTSTSEMERNGGQESDTCSRPFPALSGSRPPLALIIIALRRAPCAYFRHIIH